MVIASESVTLQSPTWFVASFAVAATVQAWLCTATLTAAAANVRPVRPEVSRDGADGWLETWSFAAYATTRTAVAAISQSFAQSTSPLRESLGQSQV